MQTLNNRRNAEAIVNTARITIRPQNRKEFCQTMTSLLEPVRHETGCLDYRFYQEAADENSFIIVSEWESRADWDNFLETEDFAVLMGTLMALNCDRNTDFKLLKPLPGSERIITERGRF